MWSEKDNHFSAFFHIGRPWNAGGHTAHGRHFARPEKGFTQTAVNKNKCGSFGRVLVNFFDPHLFAERPSWSNLSYVQFWTPLKFHAASTNSASTRESSRNVCQLKEQSGKAHHVCGSASPSLSLSSLSSCFGIAFDNQSVEISHLNISFGDDGNSANFIGQLNVGIY